MHLNGYFLGAGIFYIGFFFCSNDWIENLVIGFYNVGGCDDFI